MTLFFSLMIIGIGMGAIYAFAAQGLVLIYRGSGILNFAQGAIAFGGAEVYAHAQGRFGVWGSAAVAIGAAALLGAIVELAIMNPLRLASPLVRIIATLGILTMLQQGLVLIWGEVPLFRNGLLPTYSFRLVGRVVASPQYFWLVGIAALLTSILWVGYRYTQFGRITVAVAENEMATASLGWSPIRIATINWVIGSALGGLAGVLIEPISGTDVNTLSLLIVPALAAALVGKFKSFPITFAVSLLLGVAETELQQYVTAPGWNEAGPFLLIVLYLVTIGSSLPLRGHLLERLPRLSKPARGGSYLSILVLGGITIGLMLVLSSAFAGAVVTTVLMAFVVLSLVVLTGYAGQLSLAQWSIAGLGALFASRVGDAWSVPFLPAIALGVLATLPAGLILGLPALRTRGVNLAVSTLAVATVIGDVVLANPSFTGGAIRGTVLPVPYIFGINISYLVHPRRYGDVVVILFSLVAVGVLNLRRSRTGRKLVAIRENERAAASLGISVVGMKQYAFVLASGIAALGGALTAFQFPSVSFTQYDVFGSIDAVLYAVIGGLGSVAGALVGGTMTPGGLSSWVLSHWFAVSTWLTFVSGTLFIVVVILQPDGIVLKNQDILAQLRHGRWRRPGPSYPSFSTQEEPVRVRGATLTVTGLKVRFGGVSALQGVDMTVSPGEVVGVIGPNGAGKTTLIDTIAGNNARYEGSISFDGRVIDGWSVRKRAAAGIGRSFQSLELFEDLDVYDNLRCAGDLRYRGGLVRDLVWPRATTLPPSGSAAVREFDLAGDLGAKPGELSHGRRHLVALARSVALGPSLLLLDEPCAGLSEWEADRIRELLVRLAREWGMSMLVVEHDVDFVMATCDRVVVLVGGEVMCSGVPDAIRANPAVVEAFLGTVEAESPVESVEEAVLE